ncbi:cytochrome P450 [Coniophora puteana RWD-64-598 SS2]|uniref:Cytochrome P450 n=1 Tax=Coniophora puteana (strain RWD-64-598) TaxID=741705 RepID=A0A5M3N3F1_CONPW|nr:cytochrome P450 [Coniophora puteana RWD-64-598 SS2]EIW85932.1 cytochrome P450 [Coniophora puteana RWD-64-598 SS2]
MASHFLLIGALSALAFALLKYALSPPGAKGSLPYLPGPKLLPLLGAALDVDAASPWLTYMQWGAKYGDIIYCRFFNRHVVVLNSVKVADDLMERRSRIYSDRPKVSTIELAGWDFVFTVEPYGPEWRMNRRLFQQSFREQKVVAYRPAQLAAAHRLLANMAAYPAEKLWDLVTLFTSSAILSIVYGYDVDALDDPLFHIVEKFFETGLQLMTPEKAMVTDTFPWFKYLPTFLPGTSILREALVARRWAQQFMDFPYECAMDKLKSNPTLSCMLSEQIKSREESGQDISEYTLKRITATAFVGGAETSSSVLQSLIVAMLLNPSVQKRAQADIDAVLGTSSGVRRLPTFADRAALPYIDAIIREAMRWNPVLPVGVTHTVTEDDVYEGCFIPKGSLVTANAWAMSRDERQYPSPESFLPDRFLTSTGELNDDTVRWAFGWGRRICPGRHLANDSVWIAAVSMLAAYSFEKVGDAEPEWTTGITRHPKPMPMRVVPRFEKAKLEQMIKDTNHD